jgi:integrase
VPDSVTQRYERLAGRLGIATTFHRLRHYSATELIAGGVDPRTVAGRLGHSGGGTTTLKTYSAWVSEADQRAAKGIGARMPERPADHDPAEGVRTEPRHPYEVTAASLARLIDDGALPIGSFMPRSAELAVAHGISLPISAPTATRSLPWNADRGPTRTKGLTGRPPVSPARRCRATAFSGSGSRRADELQPSAASATRR